MKILALVTAKSTSIRVRNKNKRKIGGKPLYQWTTDFLVKNKRFFEDIVFSSDSPVSFDVPDLLLKLRRPSSLCEDKTPHVLSVRHALLHMESRTGKQYDYVILFQPTNPLRHTRDLKLFIEHVVDSNYCLGKTYYVDSNINPSYIEQAIKWEDETEAEGVIVRSGNMYGYNRKYLIVTDINKIDLSTFFLMIPKYRGYNINTKEDFDIVETFMRRYKCI